MMCCRNLLLQVQHLSKNYFCRTQMTQVRCLWKKSPDDECKEKKEISPVVKKANKLPDSWSQPKVVIIGAGIAGLSAAHQLVHSGICDVTILEATDGPGGRIQSCWFNKSIAELGASVIKGACVANSAYNLAVKEQLLQSPVPRQRLSEGVFYTSNGKPVDRTVAEKASATTRYIEAKALSIYENEISQEDTNMEIFMSSRIGEELTNFSESERESALMVMNTHLTSIKEKIGADLECIKTKYYGSSSSLPGGDVKIPGGFVGILAPLIRDIPDCAIRYCKPVECIQWDACEAEKPRACVKCADESFPADYVIITTPLGFLKDKADSFFVPNLPLKKMEAIKSLGFGHINRFFLQFPEPLWLKGEGDIMFAWRPDDYVQIDGWIKGLSSLTIDGSNEQVLSGVVAGKEAVTMELLDDDQIILDIHKQIERFSGNISIPKPSKILRSKWSTNPFIKGAYTYISTESALAQIEDLANPTPEPCETGTPVLFFAGEHTSDNYATVHGARDSGIREANRIVNYTKELKGAPSKSKNN